MVDLVSNIFLEWLKHPFVLVCLGGYALKAIFESRSNKEKLRNESVLFINSISNSINPVFPLLFDEISSISTSLKKDSEAFKLTQEPFKNRLEITIKSKAFFGDEELSKRYTVLIKEIDEITRILLRISELNMSSITDAEKEHHSGNLTQKAMNRRLKLLSEWPSEKYPNFDGRHPKKLKDQLHSELQQWLNIVFYRSEELLLKYLNLAMKQ